jgi:hypothetical protein
MQVETEKDLRIKQLRLIVFVMIVIFIAILSYTIYWLSSYNKHYGFFKETSAEVVDRVDMDGSMYDVLYYSIDGIEYKVTSDIVTDNEVGDEIKIYYDKDNPLGIIYSLDNKRIILPIITVCFGLFCVALIVIYILIYKANKLSKLIAMQSIEKADNKGEN